MRLDLWRIIFVYVLIENSFISNAALPHNTGLLTKEDGNGIYSRNTRYLNKHVDHVNENTSDRESKESIRANKYMFRKLFNNGNKRSHRLGHFKPGKKPSSFYLHIKSNEAKENIGIYVLGPNEINEESICKIIGCRRQNNIPHCTKLQYETIEKWDYMSKSNGLKSKRDSENTSLSIIKENKHTLMPKKSRSKWKLNVHTLGGQPYNFKKLSPLQYLNIQNNLYENSHLNTTILSKNVDKTINRRIQLNEEEASQQEVSTTENDNSLEQLLFVGTNEPHNNVNYQRYENRQGTVETFASTEQSYNANIVHKVDGTSQTVPRNVTENNLNSKMGVIYLQPVHDLPLKSGYTTGTSKNLIPQAGNDTTIVITIDPNTLQNKILHAEFSKKSDNKKTPAITIELSSGGSNAFNMTSLKNMSSDRKVNTPAAAKNNTFYIIHGISNLTTTNLMNGSTVTKYEEILPLLKNNDISQTRICRNVNVFTFGKMNDITKESINPLYTDYTKNLSNYDPRSLRMPFKESDEPKVIIVKTMQNNCPNKPGTCPEVICEPTPKFVECADSNCNKTTQNMEQFKELHEGYREVGEEQGFNDIYKENPKWLKACTLLNSNAAYNCISTTQKPDNCLSNLKRKRRGIGNIDLGNIGKHIKSIIIVNPKSDEDESKGITKCEPMTNDISNYNEESSVSDIQNGNKKIENRIIERYINNILANYSKDKMTLTTGGYTLKYDSNEIAHNSNHNLANKGNNEGFKSLSLTPIIIPESTVDSFNLSGDFIKLGPFNEDVIKLILQKDSVQVGESNEKGK